MDNFLSLFLSEFMRPKTYSYPDVKIAFVQEKLKNDCLQWNANM